MIPKKISKIWKPQMKHLHLIYTFFFAVAVLLFFGLAYPLSGGLAAWPTC